MKKHILPISVLALALTSQAGDSKWSAGITAGYSHTNLKTSTTAAGWTTKASPSAGSFTGTLGLAYKLNNNWFTNLLFGYDAARVKFSEHGGNALTASYKPRWHTGLGFHHIRSIGDHMRFSLGVNALFNFAHTEEKSAAITRKKSSTLLSLIPTMGFYGPLADKLSWSLRLGYKFALNTSKLNSTAMSTWKFKTKPHGLSVRTGIIYKF